MNFIDAFLSHNGKLSDKWEQYLSVYDTEIQPFCLSGQPVRVLEIGVQNGGSLEIWKKILPEGSFIVGLDVNPAVGDLVFESGIVAHVVDINDSARREELLGDLDFDIIVDDGSHLCSDVIATFKALFPRLRPGGKYFVEDLHTSYFSDFGGGLHAPTSSIEWLKLLIDAVNADHFEKPFDFPGLTEEEIAGFNRQIGRIAFYDSVCVVESLSRSKDKPYARILTGHEWNVMPVTNLLIGQVKSQARLPLLSANTLETANEAVLQDLKTAQQLTDRMSHEIAGRDLGISERDQQLAERDRRLADLDRRLSAYSGQTSYLDTQVAERDRQIAERDGQIATMERRLMDLSRQVEGRIRQVAERDRQITEMQAQALDMQRQIDECRAETASASPTSEAVQEEPSVSADPQQQEENLPQADN